VLYERAGAFWHFCVEMGATFTIGCINKERALNRETDLFVHEANIPSAEKIDWR
jgi:hypothetical protein